MDKEKKMNLYETKEINSIYNDIAVMIEKAKDKVVVSINTERNILNWNIGKYITQNILNNQKPQYGKSIMKEISEKLTLNYGKGYSRSNLSRMVNFYKSYNNFQICATLSHKLSWSHFVELLKLGKDIERRFYTTMCQNENWSVRTLEERIDSALFERTTISKRPEQTIINELELLQNKGKMTTDLFFKDPYNLEFLDLKDIYSEKDLENAILYELQKFILEMGTDFSFLERQKRITIDGQDYYMDLLFFHRKLKRLVVIELKIGKFKPEYKGQVELYLKYLDKYEKTEGEESPIAIILCSDTNKQIAKLLEMEKSNIHIAKYIDTNLLEQKLVEATKNARIQIEQRENYNKNRK